MRVSATGVIRWTRLATLGKPPETTPRNWIFVRPLSQLKVLIIFQTFQPERAVFCERRILGGTEVFWSFCDPLTKILAEGEGFEPPVRFPVQRFSRPPVSTTHTSLRMTLQRI